MNWSVCKVILPSRIVTYGHLSRSRSLPTAGFLITGYYSQSSDKQKERKHPLHAAICFFTCQIAPAYSMNATAPQVSLFFLKIVANCPMGTGFLVPISTVTVGR